MKKLCTKSAGIDLKFSRFPFIKVLSLISIAALLSSVSPILAKNLDSKEETSTNITDIKTVAVSYPKNVISAYDTSTGYLEPLDVSKDNYVTVLNTALTQKVSASADDSDYANSLDNILLEKSKPTINVSAETNDFVRSIGINTGSKTTTGAGLTPRVVGGDQIVRGGGLGNPLVYGERAKGEAHDAIVYGQVAETKADQGIAIGLTALAGKSRSNKNSIAIGSSLADSQQEEERTVSFGDFAIAFGSKAHSYANNAIAIGYDSKATEDALNGIAIGANAQAQGGSAIAFGYKATGASNDSIAIGQSAEAKQNGTIAIGSGLVTENENSKNTAALGEKSIAIGFGAKSTLALTISVGSEALASGSHSVALGEKSQVTADYGVAIGSHSVASVNGSVSGYEPFRVSESENLSYVWKSTLGAVSIGDNSTKQSRQITGVAAGKGDTDAVNVAQLKSLQDYVKQGWKLSVNGKNDKVVSVDSMVDLAAGSSNLEIIKGDKDNKINFDLAKDLTLKSIKLGEDSISDSREDAVSPVTLDTTGLIIKNGPQIITTGIHAAGKKIKGVAEGTDATDAVNFGQLQEVEKQVAASSFVKQNAETKHITIGKDTDGDKIDIANNKSEKRTLTGIKGGDISKDSSEAVIGSQLFTTNQTLATYFGGGAEYKDGKWKEPTFTFKTVKEDGEEQDETYHNVAEALTEVGASFTNVQNKITKEITSQINNAITKVEGESFIQQDKETNRLTIGAKTEGTEINVANKSGVNRVISGVADAKNNNDAVNKGQLDNSIKSVTDQLTNITQQVQGDSLLWSASDRAFVAQHGEEKAKSKLKFLLNGEVTTDSTDAINGSQLYSMSNNLAAYFSDGAGYDKNGEWKAPTFKVNTVKKDGTAGEESYDTVEKAFSAVGTSFTNIQNKITNEITKEINKTKGDALLWDNEKEAFVAQHGEEKTNSKISFLANGDITKNSMDAINGSQLYAVINSLSGYFGGGAEYKDGQWKKPTFYVSQFKKDGNGDSKKDYHDVAAAFEGVNGSLSSINERINNVAKDISSSGLNWNETEKAYDASHNGTPSKIKHVENGSVSKGSTDAVNGGQLFETNNRVKKVEESVENINQKVENIENTVTNDAVKYDKNDKGDKINKVTLAGVSESDPVVLDNVAAGDLSKDSKQAVNGSQLLETNQKIDEVLDKAKTYTDERFHDLVNHQMGDVINEAKSYTDMKFDALNYSIDGVRKEARQAAAIGIAVANLRYNETPGKLSVGFGTGLWRNKSAFAFGAGYTSESGSVLSNVSVTHSGGHWGIGAGFNVTLD